MSILFITAATMVRLKICGPLYIVYACLLSGPVISECSRIDRSEVSSVTAGIRNLELQHLHIVFRHGDRTPILYPFGSNEEFEYLWPAGRGQLTDKGIDQEFQLGQWLRTKYTRFIPKPYNGSDFHMRSTDIDRTLMSAQSVIAGVYQNSSTPLQGYGIYWRPVPVHTVDQAEDILLSSATCPCLNFLRDLRMNSKDAIDFEELHRSLFDLLNRNLGQDINRSNLWTVSDALICMKSHGVPIPNWITNDILDEIRDVDTFYWNMQFTSTTEILRLEIGVFLHAFRNHIKAIVSSTSSPTVHDHHLAVQHTLAYSCHDTDVTYLLAAFGAFDQRMIEYSGAVVLELYGPDPPADYSEFILRLLYKRGYSDSEGEYRTLSACPERSGSEGCPLDRILNYLEKYVLDPIDVPTLCSLTNVLRNIGVCD